MPVLQSLTTLGCVDEAYVFIASAEVLSLSKQFAKDSRVVDGHGR